MRHFLFGLCALLYMAGPALSQTVILTSRDGGITLEGDLLSYDGEFYRIDTVYGVLTLDGQGVICTGADCPDLTAYVADITLSGTRHMADILIPALIQAFASRNQLSVLREVESDTRSTFVLSNSDQVVARFRLRGSTTSEGFADLIADEADIAMVLREPRPAERDMAAQSGAGNLVDGRRARVIALDGMVAIVAPDQPIKSLTLDQVSEAFSGELDTWDMLNGPQVPLLRFLPSQQVGLFETFQDRIMDPYDKVMTPGDQNYDALPDLADAVARDSYAIGLTTLSEIGNADPVSLSGRCGFQQFPSVAALRTEDYPLTLPLMLYTPARRLPRLARDFLDFTASPAADLVIRRAGLVDQAITTANFNDLGDRLAHAISTIGPEAPLSQLQSLISQLRDRKRLSSTFRFRTGTDLDARSRESILRLSRALETGAFDGQSLLFVGFSDSAGPAGPNQKLAMKRARLVMEQVKSAASTADFSQIKLQAEAFGETLPMACDDTAWGRAINRRVEVWVK